MPLGSFVAPVGATFYTGPLIPEFRNNLFFVSVGYQSVFRVRFDTANRRRVVSMERLLGHEFGSFGNVVNGRDGALYVFTTNRATASDAPPPTMTASCGSLRLRRRLVERIAHLYSVTRGWPRTGRPAGRGGVSRDKRFFAEHPVGLFADRTRYGALHVDDTVD